jgi:hypothetical protein
VIQNQNSQKTLSQAKSSTSIGSGRLKQPAKVLQPVVLNQSQDNILETQTSVHTTLPNEQQLKSQQQAFQIEIDSMTLAHPSQTDDYYGKPYDTKPLQHEEPFSTSVSHGLTDLKLVNGN